MFNFYVIKTTTTILILFTLINISPTSFLNAEITSSSASWSVEQEQNELHEMLNTEKAIIDALKRYIESQEHKLSFLKRQTVEIRSIHDSVSDRDKYLYNPMNALAILKRFTADWKNLKSYAEDYLKAEDFTKNYTQQRKSLRFPTDEDYDTALINLFLIQDTYQLESQSLAVGEVNGVKLSSEMTWSDCLEIGLMSSKNGYQTYAKYWIEAALEKLSNIDDATNNSNNNNSDSTAQQPQKSLQYDKTVRAKLKIMKALLKTEYDLGNFEDALKIANEMLKLQPKQKNVIKSKKQIEKELQNHKNGKKNNKNHRNTNQDVEKQEKKTTKTVEELMIEEICREASSLENNKQIHTASWNPFAFFSPSCTYATNNLPFLLIQPFKVEILSLDPYIVIYHNILSDNQLKELKDFVVQKEQDDTFEFTKIGQKKMRQINGKLHYVIGHYGEKLYDDWQVERYNFENIMELETELVNYGKHEQAKLLFDLQQPLVGGSVIFPQLELGINLPQGSILYWSTLNEFHTYDYRSKYHVCPVIGGSQITTTTSIKNI